MPKLDFSTPILFSFFQQRLLQKPLHHSLSYHYLWNHL